MHRQITHDVPAYYRPQVQILMAVLDLEACDFVQYKPGSAWVDAEYDCVVIPRDRQWFADQLPVMRAFWDDVLVARAKIHNSQATLEDKAARLIQWTHRRFREKTCRAKGTALQEALRNQSIALRQFVEAKKKRAEDQEPEVKPRKRARAPRIIDVDVSDLLTGPPPGYGIDDSII